MSMSSEGSCSFSGCASMDPKCNAMLVNSSEEGMELKEGEDLLKCKRTKFSVSNVQPQQEVEVSDMENKVHDVLLHKTVGLTASTGHCTGDANSCAKGHAHGSFLTGSAGEEAARLLKICRASGFKEPLYDFEECGPAHCKLFSCKVTVHVKGTANTVLECFGEPKMQKKAAQEHAAQGALWCLAHLGRVK